MPGFPRLAGMPWETNGKRGGEKGGGRGRSFFFFDPLANGVSLLTFSLLSLYTTSLSIPSVPSIPSPSVAEAMMRRDRERRVPWRVVDGEDRDVETAAALEVDERRRGIAARRCCGAEGGEALAAPEAAAPDARRRARAEEESCIGWERGRGRGRERSKW